MRAQYARILPTSQPSLLRPRPIYYASLLTTPCWHRNHTRTGRSCRLIHLCVDLTVNFCPPARCGTITGLSARACPAWTPTTQSATTRFPRRAVDIDYSILVHSSHTISQYTCALSHLRGAFRSAPTRAGQPPPRHVRCLMHAGAVRTGW